MKMIDYTVEHFDADVDLIATWIRTQGIKYDMVVGIARGGLPLATVLSYRLDLPLDVISWQTRSGNHRHIPSKVLDAVGARKNVLLVDDIIDSGRAMGEILNALGGPRDNIDVATIYHNIAQPIQAKYAARTINRNTETRWINFWWERTNYGV